MWSLCGAHCTVNSEFPNVLLTLRVYIGRGHEANIYKDPKSSMSSLLVFNRVYRLEILSVMLVFSASLVN